MKLRTRLIGLLVVPLALAFSLLVAPTAAHASIHQQWSYQFGNVGGTAVGTVVHPGWQVQTLDTDVGCQSDWLKFQTQDDNLVDYNAHSDAGACGTYSAWWATNKFGSGFTMSFQWQDGHIVIRAANGAVEWASPWYNPGGVYRFLVKLGHGAWCFFSAPVQGGTWTRRWTLGPGSC